MTSQTLGNGAWTQYEYWASGALSKITHKKPDGTVFASVKYEYDKAGNVTTATLADGLTYKGDAVVTYAYDDAYRLTREKCTPGGGSSRMAYDYRYYFDGVGNRTKFIRTDLWTSDRVVVYEYSARNELTRYSDPEGTGRYWVCEYDLRGNRTKWRHTFWTDSWYSYGWDAQDRLTKVYSNSNAKTTEYKYDHAGRRAAKKVDSGAWRWYSYDGLKVVAEGTSTTSKMYYTTAPGDPGGIICRDASAGTNPLYYHYDRLGNVMAVTDSNGALCAPYTMDAFGNVLQCGTPTGYSATQSDPQPYHLTTKEWDPDSALFYFNARWYDRATGRFLSFDSGLRGMTAHDPRFILARTDTRLWNPYSFCLNNPINHVDVDGNWIELACGILGTVIGALIISPFAVGAGIGVLVGIAVGALLEYLDAGGWCLETWEGLKQNNAKTSRTIRLTQLLGQGECILILVPCPCDGRQQIPPMRE